ncbi:MAG: ferritin-like domain-containing protein [Litorimonas sp.]
MSNRKTVLDCAYDVLMSANPLIKAKNARDMRSAWLEHGVIGETLPIPLPAHPARPKKPTLVDPHEVPRRGFGTQQGRGVMLHAIAHIELNAIDLAADMIARFSRDELMASEHQRNFINDWTSVCDDEARHFMLLHDRLSTLNMAYGDCVAHNGLWDAAMNTRKSFPARLAIAPLVLEARGLDVTPGIITKLTQARDLQSVEILNIIYNDEIGHVRIGAKWFQYVAKKLDESPKALFHSLVEAYYTGQIKPPFNVQARNLAGLTEEYYTPLAKV